MKHKLWTLLACLPVLTACATGRDDVMDDEAYMKAYEKHVGAIAAAMSPGEKNLSRRFRGLGQPVAFWFDASSPKHGVTITDGKGQILVSPASLGPRDRRDGFYYGRKLPPIPETVRVTWREGSYGRDERFSRHDERISNWVGGTIIGDYTVPLGREVAKRIPDELLEEIRKNGGWLRIKIRLQDDGVLIGWALAKSFKIPGCIESPLNNYCYRHENLMPGGDFQEAEIVDGKLVKKGWYIDKNGQKIETDY